MSTLVTIQEILFDVIDLMEDNELLMNRPIEGFDEFRTLGEFLQEQRTKLEALEEQ